MDTKEKTKPSKPKKKPSGEHKKSWQETYAKVEDIKQFLSNRVMLRHNVITHRVEAHLLSDFGKPTPNGYEPVTDRMVNSLWAEMSKETPVRIQDIWRVVESDYVPEYHPFRYYLERLPNWRPEKGDYIMELSLSINVKGDSDEQILFYEYLRKWLVAMVAGWVDDEAVNNAMLVLIGEQGSYKTTWFYNLLPPELRCYFHTKTNAYRMGRDDLLTLTQYGLVCCEELETMRNAELNQLKAAMTMRSIDERAAYARYHEHRQHIASFCGTGNSVQFLTDTTGNRRWLPFEVTSIESPYTHPLNYAGIYSQAYTLYKQGFLYWFSPEEIRKLAEHNRRYETPCLERELVNLYFRHPKAAEAGEFMPVSVALQTIGANITQKLSHIVLGRAFTDLGFKPKIVHHVRGYIVVRRTAEEIRDFRSQMAIVASNTVTDVTDVF